MKEVLFYRGLRSKYNKAVHLEAIYFATDTKEIIVNGISYGSVDIDDELTEIGQNPVAGSTIYKAIRENITNAIDTAPFGNSLLLISVGQNAYQIALLDRQGNIISQTKTIVGDLSGSYDPSGLSFSRVGEQNLLTKPGKTTVLSYYFDVLDSSESSLGISGTLKVYKDNQDSEPIIEKTINPGLGTVDITLYLREGEVTSFWLEASAITNKGVQKSTLYYTVRLVNLSITSSYQVNTVTKAGQNIVIPFTVTGIRALKVLRAYLNGTEVASVEVLEASSSQSISVPTKGLSHGTHNILLRADYNIEDEFGNVITTVYSNIIYIDAIVIEDNNSTPVFSCRFDYDNGESLISGTPIINTQLYSLFNLYYYVYDTNSSREVEFYSDGESVGSNTFSDASLAIKYRYTTLGTKVCYFECNGMTYDFVVVVNKSNYTISEPTSSLSLYLDALGKNNSSSSRDQWTYNNITSTFENFNWSGNGWTGDSLKLFNGSKVTINHQPFAPAASGALAFTIKLKVTNVMDPEEVLVSCVDPYGRGLVITAQEAKLTTQSGTVSTKFATGLTYTIGFVSYPVASTTLDSINNANMCYVYVDGIISGGILKKSVNDIYQIIPQNITIQASSCELEVYSIRSYSTQLSDDEIFNCYLIDLVDSELIDAKYENNDVLDLTGNISIDKITENGVVKIPYFVITGPSVIEGRSQFEHVAITNDKDPKYDVDSILYVDTDPKFNFYCIPGKKSPQIRLLGTSSMAYPRKNYRIYTKDTNLYLGCDKNGEGGTLQDSPKYSMSATAAPVNCWCLKADAAESSSSHNTGTTGLVEEVLNKINFKTPAQKYVSSDHPYQVRTTVEGHPCLVFYRNSSSDTPKFGGKYNFNNDKSTEDVFGFLDIPGYNDNESFLTEMLEATDNSMVWGDFVETSYTDGEKIVTVTKLDIVKMLGNNPTECWEFSNNSTRMGNFLEADFDKVDPDSTKGELYWMTSWEARFPDEDGLNAAFKAGVKPYYLMNLAKWIVSTNTDQATNLPLKTSVVYNSVVYANDTAEYRLAKFRNELHYYFDVNYLCAYYLFTDCLAAADQRVKNMMWGFWYNPDAEKHEIMGKMRCYPIFYDNDTILGLDNTGKLALNWDVDENTMNGEAPAFAGHDSTIWINLRSQFKKELEEVYVTMSSGSNFVGATMLKWYNTNLSDRYCERIYNKDSLYKYIIPLNVGVDVVEEGKLTHKPYDYLNQMHGSRRAHRSWFIDNRMDLFNARYQGGNFKESEINWKGAITPEVGESISLSVETSREYYVAVHSDMTGLLTHLKLNANEPITVLLNAEKVDIGAIYHVYGIRWIKSLDLSNWGGFESLTATATMPTLETLILGGHRGSAAGFSTNIFNYIPAVKYLDMTNIKLSSIDLTKCPYLETLIATGTNLTSVLLAEGSNISEMYLPETFNTLSLIGQSKITNDSIHFENTDNLLNLRIEKCENVDSLALLNSIISSDTNNLKYIRITNLNISGNGDDLIRYKNAGLLGLDSYGNAVLDKCKLVGTYKLTKLLDVETYNSLSTYFDELNIQQPTYTEILFDMRETTPEKITNMDNQTGKLFGNDYIPSGYITRILNKRHSYLVKETPEVGVFAAMLLDDTNSRLYADGTISALDGSEGDYCGYEPHYWYKGVNDHKNKTLHAYFSDLTSVPTSHKGLKVSVSDCEVKKGYKVVTSNAYSKIYDALISDGGRTSYIYTIPSQHNYKQFRVNGIVSSSIGALVADSEGNILVRLYADEDKGMFNQSYLFDTLPSTARFIYFTTDNVNDYCLYLTESEDIEAIEPDWVEHKEEFIGRVLSTPYNDSIKSFVPNILNTVYSDTANGLSIVDNCALLNKVGYYAFDYEAYKNIIMLAYAKYGTTGLHSDVVGAGCGNNGDNILNGGRYFPNSVDYTLYGLQDTSTSGVNDSYYIKNDKPVDPYPYTATLMGYHQFVCLGSTCSNNDIVKRGNNPIYTNNRTKRSVYLYPSTNDRFNTFILGGRYLDIFGTTYSNTGDSTGFCGGEKYNSGTNNTGYLSIGLSNNSSTKVSTYLEVSNGTPTSGITKYGLTKVLRVLIIPTKINFCKTSSEFKAL